MPDYVSSLTPAAQLALAREVLPWENHARPEQLWPEGDHWSVWLINAGRKFGKTRTGKEYTHKLGMRGGHRLALVGRTYGDLRHVMIEGPSGLLARDITLPDEMPKYFPGEKPGKIVWPRPRVRHVAPAGQVAVGAPPTIGETFSSDEPDSLRGPQWSFAWCDELAAWKYLESCWMNLSMGLTHDVRGWRPRRIVTTTPRPLNFLKDMIADPRTVMTTGSMYDNIANLPKDQVEELREKYEGTQLGEQELNARILDESEGALWRREWIDRYRVESAPVLSKIVVGVDPATTSKNTSSETGIVVVGVAPMLVKARKSIPHYYVLEDRSIVGKPHEWAGEVAAAYEAWQADVIVGEGNNGGEMVESTMKVQDENLPVVIVWASRGKKPRAEPVSLLAQQGRVHHVGRNLRALEDQLCTWEPLDNLPSPDRLDAFVWAMRACMVKGPTLPESLAGLGDADRVMPEELR